ncbi:hypothetical protein PHET_12300 [Paragonimus heterotremus]|uniref:Uncharacterized protein n=1 Tax=Paragonimus heterotremus TaxID=100268 RepID=A0A8J4T2F3_9TREM|nr:hypothetical protein PHET_12300 [Paragonimus heterotremus]
MYQNGRHKRACILRQSASTSVACRCLHFPGDNGVHTPPTTDADLNRSADTVALSHGPRKLRIDITWSDYPVDISAENITCDERHDDEDFL